MTFKLKKDERYIFATDLDGTFLTEFVSGIHATSYDAVEKIKEAGHHFVISTGRSWWWTKTIYEQLGSVDATINFSGAIIHHPKDPNFKEFRKSVSQVVLKDMINKMDIWSFANIVMAVGRKQHAVWSKGDDLTNLFFNCYEYLIQFPISSMTKDEIIKKIEDIIGVGYVIRVWNLFGDTENYTVVISPQNTDKSIALEEISKYYDVPQSNVIYFGDNLNDLGALEWAGHGYAVENARQEAKDSADEILELDSNHGAVPKKIMELIDEQAKE